MHDGTLELRKRWFADSLLEGAVTSELVSGSQLPCYSGKIQGISSILAFGHLNLRQNSHYNQCFTSKFPTQKNRELIGPYQAIKSAYQGSFLPDEGRGALVGAPPGAKSAPDEWTSICFAAKSVSGASEAIHSRAVICAVTSSSRSSGGVALVQGAGTHHRLVPSRSRRLPVGAGSRARTPVLPKRRRATGTSATDRYRSSLASTDNTVFVNRIAEVRPRAEKT
jgi:hypothetical protein